MVRPALSDDVIRAPEVPMTQKFIRRIAFSNQTPYGWPDNILEIFEHQFCVLLERFGVPVLFELSAVNWRTERCQKQRIKPN